jgi:hypothetical protein
VAEIDDEVITKTGFPDAWIHSSSRFRSKSS